MVLLESANIPLGTKAPDFKLKGVDENEYGLENFVGAKILVIVFMCNHCPYVQAVWNRLVKLQERFKDKAVQFVGINSNFNPDYEEDSFENMKLYYKKYNMNFPYLLDETQEVAKQYKAQCTPDIYVFDSERKLAYHGCVDDKEELADAIETLLAGNRPSEIQYPSRGCSIKWRE